MDPRLISSSEERRRSDSVARSKSVEMNQIGFVENLRWNKLLKFGMPTIGWLMLVIEIIPTFDYFALTHFHLSYQDFQYFKNIDYMIHFYAILASVPSVFLIAILSDGYVYGKFIAAVIVLSLSTLTGMCSVLISLDFMDKNINSALMKVSVFSVYFYFVAIPIRLTIFADLVSHNKNQPNARKCFTLFWVVNLLGAAFGLQIFKHFYDIGDPSTISKLTMALVGLTMIYFLGACLIVMALPLQLQTTNLFLYHMRCVCYAIGHQPSCKNWNILKPGRWLEVASKKFTWTEVKRTKSIYFLSLYIIPVTCYFDCQSLMYFYWYDNKFAFTVGGKFMDDYSFFYLHMILTSLISLIIQFGFLPLLSYAVKKPIKESWIFFTGYLFLGMSLILLLQSEIVCNTRDPSRYFNSTQVSVVRLINGYPHEICLLSEWNGKLMTARPGEVVQIKVNKEKLPTFGETPIFKMPQFQMVDMIATTVKENKFKNYLVSDGSYEVINVEGTDLLERTRDKLSWIHRKFNGTILILCSAELQKEEHSMHCYYENGNVLLRMPTVQICRSDVDFSTGSKVKRTIPVVLNYYPRTYMCRTSDEQLHHLAVEPKVFYLLYYMKTSPSTPKNSLLPNDLDTEGSSFVKTDLTPETCSMAPGLLLLQIMMHALSTSCMLVSTNTMVCLYGPPRLRMISYAVLYVGVFTGMAVIRVTVLANLQMIDLCSVHMGIYAFGLLFLLYNVNLVKFEMHTWEQPWRPSIWWKVSLFVRNWVLYKKFLSEKGPQVDSNERTEKSILQSDVDRDRRSEDDKTPKKVTFHQIEVDPTLLVKVGNAGSEVTSSDPVQPEVQPPPLAPQPQAPSAPSAPSAPPRTTTVRKPQPQQPK